MFITKCKLGYEMPCFFSSLQEKREDSPLVNQMYFSFFRDDFFFTSMKQFTCDFFRESKKSHLQNSQTFEIPQILPLNLQGKKANLAVA